MISLNIVAFCFNLYKIDDLELFENLLLNFLNNNKKNTSKFSNNKQTKLYKNTQFQHYQYYQF